MTTLTLYLALLNAGQVEPKSMGQESLEKATLHLISALQSTSSDVRFRAVRTLTALGPNAFAAVDPLVTSLKGGANETDRLWDIAVFNALEQIGPGAKSAARQISSHLGDRGRGPSAARALVSIGPTDTAVNAIREILLDDDDDAKGNAVRVIKGYGQASLPLADLCITKVKNGSDIDWGKAYLYAMGHHVLPILAMELSATSDADYTQNVLEIMYRILVERPNRTALRDHPQTVSQLKDSLLSAKNAERASVRKAAEGVLIELDSSQ